MASSIAVTSGSLPPVPASTVTCPPPSPAAAAPASHAATPPGETPPGDRQSWESSWVHAPRPLATSIATCGYEAMRRCTKCAACLRRRLPAFAATSSGSKNWRAVTRAGEVAAGDETDGADVDPARPPTPPIPSKGSPASFASSSSPNGFPVAAVNPRGSADSPDSAGSFGGVAGAGDGPGATALAPPSVRSPAGSAVMSNLEASMTAPTTCSASRSIEPRAADLDPAAVAAARSPEDPRLPIPPPPTVGPSPPPTPPSPAMNAQSTSNARRSSSPGGRV